MAQIVLSGGRTGVVIVVVIWFGLSSLYNMLLHVFNHIKHETLLIFV